MHHKKSISFPKQQLSFSEISAQLLAEYVKEFHKQSLLQNAEEQDIHMGNIIIYLKTYLPLIQSNKNYVPTRELNMLLDNTSSWDTWAGLAVPLLLVDISDIVIARCSLQEKDAILKKVGACLDVTADEDFEELLTNRKSPTITYIKNTLHKPITTIAEIINEIRRRVKQESAILFFSQFEKLFKGIIDEASLHNLTRSNNQLETWLTSFISLYKESLLWRGFFEMIIKSIQSHYPDKLAFTRICLKSYQKAYESASIDSVNFYTFMNNLLRFLYLLDGPLAGGELNKAMRDVSFNLKNRYLTERPRIPTPHDEKAYPNYQNLMAVLYGEQFYDTASQEQGLKDILLLQMLVKKALSEFKLDYINQFTMLPPLLHHTIKEFSLSLQNAFAVFVQRFMKINGNAPTHQQRNKDIFFTNHAKIMFQLIEIMDIEAIYYMQRHMALTILPLDNILINMSILDNNLIKFLKKYFSDLHLTVKKNFAEIEIFKTCLITIASLEKYTGHHETSYYENMANGKSPKEFLLALQTQLIKHLLGNEFDLSPEKITEIFKHLLPIHFAKLVCASETMEDNDYREIFFNLLRLDLLHGDIDDFLHNLNQENKFGRELAEHNRKIQMKLIAHDISPQNALRYDKKYNFIVVPENDAITVNNYFLVLWSYLGQLKNTASNIKTTSKLDAKNSERIDAILKAIANLQERINRYNRPNSDFAVVDVLSHKESLFLLKKIVKNCKALKENKAEGLGRNFYEFSEHVTLQLQLIDTIHNEKSNMNNKKKNISYYFSVEQWPKNKALTFFLGDEVGCCLATTSFQFRAMVQRRMDDAMLFHVAIDNITKRPAALIWLYLAETEDDRIVLVANFFEVNAKYGSNNTLRKSLLNGLLEFTYQYLRDNPNIDSFYMNKLSYGWNVGDLNKYPVQNILFTDKVGGAYIPEKIANNYDLDIETTQKQYYLVSLAEKEFHQFNPMILAKETTSNSVSLERLIQQTIFKLTANEKNIDKVRHELINGHRFELQPFFEKPLETDAAFKKVVASAFEKALVYYLSKGITTSGARLVSAMFFYHNDMLSLNVLCPNPAVTSKNTIS